MPARRRTGRNVRVVGLVTAMIAVGALLGGCGGEPDPSGGSTETESRTLDVVIADGEVTPNAERVEVVQGTHVILKVKSDVADAVHVHGYDEELEVEPDEPATLEFDADETGRFEIETHESDKLVYQLVVTP
jgi:hypothetical protein